MRGAGATPAQPPSHLPARTLDENRHICPVRRAARILNTRGVSRRPLFAPSTDDGVQDPRTRLVMCGTSLVEESKAQRGGVHATLPSGAARVRWGKRREARARKRGARTFENVAVAQWSRSLSHRQRDATRKAWLLFSPTRAWKMSL